MVLFKPPLDFWLGVLLVTLIFAWQKKESLKELALRLLFVAPISYLLDWLYHACTNNSR